MYFNRGAIGSSVAERALGGLNYDDCSSDDDMKVSDDEAKEGVVGVDGGDDDDGDACGSTAAAITKLVFPEPVPAIFYSNDGKQFRFDKAVIPPQVKGIPPQIMQGAAAIKEETARQKACISFQPLLPGVVHASPMVALLESIVVRAPPKAGAPVCAPDKQPQPTSVRYVSVLKSCYQLQQFKMACHNGLFPLAPSMIDKLDECAENYLTHVRGLSQGFDERLDELLASAKTRAREEVLASFLALVEQHALDYIHTLEHYLYTCLIEPRLIVPIISLAAVLTPNQFPSLDACSEDTERKEVMDDVVAFFAHKERVRDEQVALNAKNGVTNTDYVAMPLRSTAIMELFHSTDSQHLYKGYLPKQTAIEYLFYMDTDGVLSSAETQ